MVYASAVAVETFAFEFAARVIVVPLMLVTVEPSKVDPTTNVLGTPTKVTDVDEVELLITVAVPETLAPA